MIVDYSLAQHWAQTVEALAMTEHAYHIIGEACLWRCPFGSNDGGRAFGLLQFHPATFAEWYERNLVSPPSPAHTWTEAQIVAMANFLEERAGVMGLPLDRVIQENNVGITAYTNGQRNANYLSTWTQALNRIRGRKA